MQIVAPVAPSNALMTLLAKYDGRAPRYTSYPTAVQFTPEVDGETYQRWLAELALDQPVSLYAHIPMCDRLCWYCGCNTRAVHGRQTVTDYVALLVQEIALAETKLPGRLKANALHLGGGTPNMMSPDNLATLFGALKHVFQFEADAEIAAELDPAVLTEEWVKAAAFHGLNRASLGVQNLSPVVQAAVNREESFEEIERCVGWLRAAEVKSINLDLMYGLPHQTTANTLSTLHKVLTLRPERLALFGYAHVPWMKAHQKLIDEKALPGAAERLEQSEAAAALLIAEGYVRIGLDHFALPEDELSIALAEGRMHRNFQGYTTDAASTLLGFGASAISSLPQGFVQNIPQEHPWREAVASGRAPIARGVALTPDDRWRGEIIERLMCDLAVDVADVSAHHGRDWRDLSDALARLTPFVEDGLAVVDGAKVRMIGDGRLVVRSACAAFDAYFAPEAERHSRTL